ncbi:hypothetical protein ATE92_0061 [Ulvibacter sp. MAR_2010_11]|uniref:hypothetical protein n=1 Tax=Ulvibacter sp. MAR_2010_11 TaxID=1250229 RepID=UPI000CC69750|nr:hypothetical protein [Ulvibacter sp. MAR_2010_11]PKA81940.1 hypothetical protein ATE92_0061 [Ulvibacter sp. MAR_2010_11]
MVSFSMKSDNSLTVIVDRDFDSTERERIALFIESLFDSNFHGKICFALDVNLKMISVQMIADFCERLPYNYTITQKVSA